MQMQLFCRVLDLIKLLPLTGGVCLVSEDAGVGCVGAGTCLGGLLNAIRPQQKLMLALPAST